MWPYYHCVRDNATRAEDMDCSTSYALTDEGLNSNVAWVGTWQTLLPDTNDKLNGMSVKL